MTSTFPDSIETRNGSDQTLKQHVWGTRYIDELVQISTNDDPADGSEQVCETNYWVCQDANYNVLGIVDSSAVLKERYEYKPYGERTVFFSPGANDVGLYSPTLNTRAAGCELRNDENYASDYSTS